MVVVDAGVVMSGAVVGAGVVISCIVVDAGVVISGNVTVVVGAGVVIIRRSVILYASVSGMSALVPSV